MKRFLSIMLFLVFVLLLVGCDETENSSTGIYNFTIEDLSSETFYDGITFSDFELEVDSTSEYKTSDINVVVIDPTIISISFEKKDTLFSNYISFNITGLKTGTTSFYFETVDQIIKSEEIQITVSQNIESISFRDTSDIVFSEWSYEESKSFDIESNKSSTDLQDSLEFVSENPEIVTIEYDEDSLFSNYCIIKKVGVGETYVYIQNKDGTIQSEKIKVIVEEEEPEETEAVYEEPVDNSRTVYITPTGKKYHYSRSCAGENAIETTEKSAKTMHDPCKKCAQ